MLVPDVLSLNHIVRDVSGMVRRLVGEHIELVIDAAHDLGMVKTDPTQMGQVILNLAMNARDAMPQGGKLTIATANAEIKGYLRGAESAIKPGRYAVLSIADTGCGMAGSSVLVEIPPDFRTRARATLTWLRDPRFRKSLTLLSGAPSTPTRMSVISMSRSTTWLVMLAALWGLAGAADFGGVREFYAYPSLQYFTWEEYLSGRRLLREEGMLYSAGAAVAVDLLQTAAGVLTLHGKGELFGGVVDYDGQTQRGLPVTTEVSYVGTKTEGAIGWALPLASSRLEPS